MKKFYTVTLTLALDEDHLHPTDWNWPSVLHMEDKDVRLEAVNERQTFYVEGLGWVTRMKVGND